jgi:hypothetical protein
MTKERFNRGYRLLALFIVGISGLLVIGHNEHHLSFSFPLDENTSIVLLLFGAVLFLLLRDLKTTHLEITDSRLLKNSGYHDFGDDIIDIRNIKYIYRVPQFPLAWFGGSLMVIYHTDENGKIRHSALREINYSSDTLKKFLLRMKEIKSTIELDAEYLLILEDKRSFRESSDNTVATVEQRLRDKGEKWDTVSTLQKFLGKF